MNRRQFLQTSGLGAAGLLFSAKRLFAAEFADPDSYASNLPDAAYLTSVLAQPNVVALVAYDGEDMTGGLVAYVLPKLEQVRSENHVTLEGDGPRAPRRKSREKP